jgi:hypothetical protein
LAVTCREGHTALWCKVEPHMPTFPIVNYSSCHIIVDIMSDHVVASEVGNLYRERGVDSSTGASDTPVWSPPSGLTDTARNTLIKAVDRVPSAWLLSP